jgi:hypothetical protein
MDFSVFEVLLELRESISLTAEQKLHTIINSLCIEVAEAKQEEKNF